MAEEFVRLDDLEASLALHALRFYKNAKGFEVSQNTLDLEKKLSELVEGSRYVVDVVESPASMLGARGGLKGGTSTSDAKRAAAAANGSKGGRPRNPNLFVKFSKSVWSEPDAKLLEALAKASGSQKWLPQERKEDLEGPYVRLVVDRVTEKLESLLRNSLNVWEWDEKPFYNVCNEHGNNFCKPIVGNDEGRKGCLFPHCKNVATLVY